MATRFAEKRMEQDDGDERGGLSSSSGGEILSRRRLSDTPEIEVSSWESSRGAEAGSSVRARRRVPTLARQLPLQGTPHGAFGKGCARLQGGLHGRAAGAHGGGGQRGGS